MKPLYEKSEKLL